MFLPGGAWFMSRDTSDDPVYGDSFIMHAPTQQQGQQQQVQGLVLQRQKPRGVAVRQPQPSCEIVPLLLDEVEVSIVVLPMEEKSLGIVPFKQMVRDVAVSIMPFDQPLLEPPASSSDSSSCLAIVPRESNTMLGVVMGSAVRRRDDGLQLPMVSTQGASVCGCHSSAANRCQRKQAVQLQQYTREVSAVFVHSAPLVASCMHAQQPPRLLQRSRACRRAPTAYAADLCHHLS